MSYLDATNDLYKAAAQTPDVGLCCTTNPIWKLPELEIPTIMLNMNYGCGSTVNPGDLDSDSKVLYVGVGGGMELLQFAYFTRKKNSVIGVDVVDEMIEASQNNFKVAEKLNPWFNSDFINLKKGNALNLPVENESIDVAAQNCLFNIFKIDDLKKALAEMYRILKPRGRLVLSDPICDDEMPESLRADDKLRALCLSGSLPFQEYIDLLVEAGFGTIEVRARRPYRILSPNHYDTDKLINIESVEICAIKDPVLPDGACVFTGKTAIYYGTDEYFNDNKGHILVQNTPLAICDKTAKQFSDLNRDDIYISPSNYFYNGGGCC